MIIAGQIDESMKEDIIQITKISLVSSRARELGTKSRRIKA